MHPNKLFNCHSLNLRLWRYKYPEYDNDDTTSIILLQINIYKICYFLSLVSH